MGSSILFAINFRVTESQTNSPSTVNLHNFVPYHFSRSQPTSRDGLITVIICVFWGTDMEHIILRFHLILLPLANMPSGISLNVMLELVQRSLFGTVWQVQAQSFHFMQVSTM